MEAAMPDNDLDDLATTWSEKFLPARLFSTFGMALFPTTRLLLCLACVLVCYTAGRVLDRIWLGGGAGVTVSVAGERVQTEILGSSVFERLIALLGPQFETLCLKKIRVVVGDLTSPRLGLRTRQMRKAFRAPPRKPWPRQSVRTPRPCTTLPTSAPGTAQY